MRKSISFVFFFIFFFILFTNTPSIFAFEIPSKPQSFVSDYASILKIEEKNILEQKISTFEKQNGAEIAVVIIPSLDGDTIENLAQNIFTKWGIGKVDNLPAGRQGNNGVLILIAILEHQTRIQTGYGVEGDLTDVQTKRIQDQIMRPAFRAGDYIGGINGAVDAIGFSLSGQDISKIISEQPQKNPIISFISQFWQLGVFIFWIFLIFRRRKNKNGRSNIWWFIGGPPFGGGGSGGGGGFGGFGGGSSGGGGSSSSW